MSYAKFKDLMAGAPDSAASAASGEDLDRRAGRENYDPWAMHRSVASAALPGSGEAPREARSEPQQIFAPPYGIPFPSEGNIWAPPKPTGAASAFDTPPVFDYATSPPAQSAALPQGVFDSTPRIVRAPATNAPLRGAPVAPEVPLRGGGGGAVEITDMNTKSSLVANNKLVVVDVYSTRCEPCKSIAGRVDALADKYRSKGVVVAKENVDLGLQQPKGVNIRGVPSFLFYKNNKYDGLVAGSDVFGVEAMIQSHLQNM
jgi:thioredoxin 1